MICRSTGHNPPAPASAPAAELGDDAEVTIDWGDAPEADVSYELEYRDANDADWRPLANDLTTSEHTVADHPEGAWAYRVRTTNSHRGISAYVESTDELKVDKTAPTAPSASTREPDFQGWFKDSVTVSWTGSTDPLLADGSLGSGIAGYSLPKTVTSDGETTTRGRARDAAGNESAEATHNVLVDTAGPEVTITCPEGPIQVGDDASAQWRATDGGVGVRGAAAGHVPLDTSSRGNRTAESPVVLDELEHESAIVRCDYRVKGRPTQPGAPRGPDYDRDGTFKLTWDPSTDADGDPFTYQVIGRRGTESYATIAVGLTEPQFDAEDLPEGAWDFGVRAVESPTLASDYNVGEDVTKVDGTAPTAPVVSTDPGAPAEGTGGWFKGRVTVSFDGSTDPNLGDGSAGSDIASYSGNAVFDTTGTHTTTGFATDHAGNESDRTTKTVKVDATAPAVNITCPTEELIVGQTAKANWTASDVGSGLATSATGAVTLDTSTAGTRTATAPEAKDKVGHTKTATCTYQVRYRFAGSVGPVEGSNVVNVGRRWRKYPIRWRLTTWSGATISDTRGIELAREMSVSDDRVACTSFLGMAEDEIESEDPTATQSVRYDTSSNTFVYAYEAPSIGCYTVDIRKADGVNSKRWRFLFLP